MRADLTGADLTGSDLTDADLTGARYPQAAPIPEGWVRDEDSGRLNRPGHESPSSVEAYGLER
jgi:hypothetical protein